MEALQNSREITVFAQKYSWTKASLEEMSGVAMIGCGVEGRYTDKGECEAGDGAWTCEHLLAAAEAANQKCRKRTVK